MTVLNSITLTPPGSQCVPVQQHALNSSVEHAAVVRIAVQFNLPSGPCSTPRTGSKAESAACASGQCSGGRGSASARRPATDPVASPMDSARARDRFFCSALCTLGAGRSVLVWCDPPLAATLLPTDLVWGAVLRPCAQVPWRGARHDGRRRAARATHGHGAAGACSLLSSPSPFPSPSRFSSPLTVSIKHGAAL